MRWSASVLPVCLLICSVAVACRTFALVMTIAGQTWLRKRDGSSTVLSGDLHGHKRKYARKKLVRYVIRSCLLCSPNTSTPDALLVKPNRAGYECVDAVTSPHRVGDKRKRPSDAEAERVEKERVTKEEKVCVCVCAMCVCACVCVCVCAMCVCV
jgi:hypothetical protein